MERENKEPVRKSSLHQMKIGKPDYWQEHNLMHESNKTTATHISHPQQSKQET